ncbi:hypothetical protein TNCV_3967141 [Trichonephila clavipes]|nr:hypothetical protein TNCV_3967141 [Trichonephila clavipes]
MRSKRDLIDAVILSPRIKADSEPWRLYFREPFEAPSTIDKAKLSPRIEVDFGTVEIAKEQLHGGLRVSELTRIRRGITEIERRTVGPLGHILCIGQRWRTSGTCAIDGTRPNILGTPPIKTVCILIQNN